MIILLASAVTVLIVAGLLHHLHQVRAARIAQGEVLSRAFWRGFNEGVAAHLQRRAITAPSYPDGVDGLPIRMRWEGARLGAMGVGQAAAEFHLTELLTLHRLPPATVTR
jgi:hypothetical protein